MGKRCEKEKMTRCRENLPFKCGEAVGERNFPRNLKGKQRAWMLAGLKAMKAPIATWGHQVEKKHVAVKKHVEVKKIIREKFLVHYK